MDTLAKRLSYFIDFEGVSYRKFEEKIGASNGVMRKAISKDTSFDAKWISSIVVNYPHLSPEWLLTGKGGMLRSEVPAVPPEGGGGIPLYGTVEAFAGGVLEGSGLGAEYVTGFLSIPGLSNAHGAIHVYGDSMAPHFRPSDIIIVRKTIDSQELPFGRPAVIVTISGTVRVKYLYPDGELHYSLVSANPAYAPLRIPRQEVRYIYTIIGKVERYEVG